METVTIKSAFESDEEPPRKVQMRNELPQKIHNTLKELSSDVPSVSKDRAIKLLRMGALDLSDLVIFEDDGDLVLHWTGRAIYCDFMKDSNSYRANKVIKQDGAFVSNVVFLSSVNELYDWLGQNLE